MKNNFDRWLSTKQAQTVDTANAVFDLMDNKDTPIFDNNLTTFQNAIEAKGGDPNDLRGIFNAMQYATDNIVDGKININANSKILD